MWTLAVVYLAYMTHGIQAIVLSQNLDAFAQQWACGTAGVYTAISFTGLAKFLTVWICGELSDKIGRRPMALIGGIMYVVFFGGCLLTRNFTLACVFAFMAGAATSFFDGSLYAAAQESWPKATGTSVILIKGFISISGLIYPMLVVSLRASGAWIVGLIIPIVMSVLLLIITFIAPFSYDDELKQRKLSGWKPATAADKLDADARAAADRFKTPAPKWLVVPLAVMGFINMCTMYSAQQLLNRYGLTVVGMSDMASASLTSLYTGGSLCAVLIWALLMSKFRWRTLKILIIDLAGSVISYAIVISTKSQAIVMIAAFTIGFFAAGGALQCGVSLIRNGSKAVLKRGGSLHRPHCDCDYLRVRDRIPYPGCGFQCVCIGCIYNTRYSFAYQGIGFRIDLQFRCVRNLLYTDQNIHRQCSSFLIEYGCIGGGCASPDADKSIRLYHLDADA